MKTSLADPSKLADDDPAKPVVKQLLEWLIADNDFPDFPYNPDDHGYIALVEPGDVDHELDDIDMPRLTDIMWEGVSIIDGFYHAVYLGAGDYGMVVLRQAYADGDKDSEYVFVNKRTGKPHTTIQKQWERIREKAGLRHCRLHDLRHTFASYLANSGRSLLEIQTLLGHASPKVTLRYSHLSQQTLMDASNTASDRISFAMKKSA